MKNYERQVSEEATGIRQNPAGLGKVYDDQGIEIRTKKEIRDLVALGDSIAIPNAGAGSYREVFCELLKCRDVKTLNTSSSAGDWSFGVKKGRYWHPAFQNNRYPHFGFTYSIDWLVGEPTFDLLCQHCEA